MTRTATIPGEEPKTTIWTPDEWIGRTLGGRYKTVELIGTGATALLFRGEDQTLNRDVAIKVLHESLEANEEVRGRFEREARALAALSHPHIVGVLDFGIDGTAPYLVIELLEGETVAAVLERERTIAAERAFEITRQVLKALAFAHDRGLLHRDLKPANIILSQYPDGGEHAKLVDFGLAKFLGPPEREGVALTRTGTISGTPEYMPPEQAAANEVDARADLYAAAVVLFEMLAGRAPFEGDVSEVLRAKLVQDPPALGKLRRDLVVSPELEALLAKGMAREKEERFASAAELIAALDALPTPPLKRAPLPKPTFRGPEAPRQPLPKVVLVAIALGAPMLLAVCGGGLFVSYMLMSGPDEQSGEASTAADLLPFGDSTGTNVLDGDELPPPLQTAAERIEAGEEIDRPQINEINTYAREHPEDARPQLLLGHAYSAKGWRSDAVTAYQIALRLDPETKNDGRMLDNLVMIAASSRRGEQAAELIERTWGRDAIEAIDRAERSGNHRGASAQRLRELRERVGGDER